MGTGSSINGRSGTSDTDERTTFGDKVEITRNLPVENFGRDDAPPSKNEVLCQRNSSEANPERNKEMRSKAASIRSVMTSIINARGDTIQRTRSDNHAADFDVMEFKLQHMIHLKTAEEGENKRLRSELSTHRSVTSKWRNACSKAENDERQALLRAKNLEKELNGVKRRFKCYRDGKEKEIHNLVKKCQELENVLRQFSAANVTGNHDIYPLPERLITPFENDSSIENLSLFKEPGSLRENGVPDCNTVFPLLAQVMTTLKLPNNKQTFKCFLSFDKEARRDIKYLKKVLLPKLKQLCEENGKFFIVVESCSSDKQRNGEHLQMARCDLFFGMLGNPRNSHFLEEWRKLFHVFKENNCPLMFCIKDAKNNLTDGTELTHFIDLVAGYNRAKVSFYTQASILVEENDAEIQSMIKEHFEITDDNDVKEHFSISDEMLISDCESSFQQLEMLHLSATLSSSDVGFTKYYEQLNEYVSGAGPSPPLLISGASGAGKTSLLAKWISMQLSTAENIVLYHFVGNRACDRSTSPGHVVKRFASQLLGLVPCLCYMLHCDPVKCEEYFPWLLETVPSRVDTNIVIVIDGVDKLKNATTCSHLSWLNDPLPPTVRVILSVTEGSEPSQWRSWPSVHISALTVEESCDVLVSCWRNPLIKLKNEEANQLLETLCDTAITTPLFLTMLSIELSRSSILSASIKEYSSFKNVVELTASVLKTLEEYKGELVNQVLAYVCCSCVGLAEAEIMELLSLQWCEWSPVLNTLVFYRSILVEWNGLLVVSHEQILKSILAHLGEEEILKAREQLVEFYLKKLNSNVISSSLVDQLPWLLETTEEREKLQEFISRIDVFEMFIQRSQFSELIGYWRYLNIDSNTYGNLYFKAIKKKEGSTPCLDTARLYETLGRFLKGLQVLTLARNCLERSLEMKEMVLESDAPWVGQSLHHLADLYVLLGNLESAESSYKQTLEINENALGKDHPLVAKELECLAYVKKKQNKGKACAELNRKAARIRRKSVLATLPMCSWPNHFDPSSLQVDNLGTGRTTPELATSLYSLGLVFMMKKRYLDAEKLFKKSLDMRESLLGVTHPAVSQSLDSLASLYQTKKMFSEAITHYEKSVEIKQKNLEPADPNLISTMNRLAMVFRKDGKLERSESTYREVLTALEHKHDDRDPVIAVALHNLAVVNSEQATDSASKWLWGHLISCVESPGDNIPNIPMFLFAEAVEGAKKLKEALGLFEQALEIYESALGSCHPKVAEILRNLAKVHLDMDNSQEASHHLRRCQLIQENDLTLTTISSQPSCAVDTWMDNSTVEFVVP